MSKLRKAGCCCALMVIFVCTFTGTARAARTTCAGSKIIVVAEKGNEIEAVCAAVQNGLLFLRSVGLDFSGSLLITLLKSIPGNGLESSLGQYDARRNEIHLLDYDTAVAVSRRSPPAFGVPMDAAIWQGFAVHELSHAVAHPAFVMGVSFRTASEYIASVAMISTLPPDEQNMIIRNYPELSGFDKPGEITFGYYLLDPSRFSVNAYLHFSKPGNGRLFIEGLLRDGLQDE